MPGLLRGVARTAVIAGTATAVSNNVTRRQMARHADDYQQTAPEPQAPAPVAGDDPYAEIERLAQLKDQGILTQEEFDAKKRQLLGL